MRWQDGDRWSENLDGSASQRRATEKMVVLYIVLYPMLYSPPSSQLLRREVPMFTEQQGCSSRAIKNHTICSKLLASQSGPNFPLRSLVGNLETFQQKVKKKRRRQPRYARYMLALFVTQLVRK